MHGADEQETLHPAPDDGTDSEPLDDSECDAAQELFGSEPWWDERVGNDAPTGVMGGNEEDAIARPFPAQGESGEVADVYAELLNTRVGNYELLEILGRGGMGVVFRARQVNLNRVVCLKMMRLPGLANAAEFRRFHAETLAIARLQHPNIVGIHDVGQHQGAPYFSMEYVEGVPLSKVIAETPLRAEEAARHLLVIAEAVAYAHENGIIHRDLKPSNVILDPLGRPRITDFGIAKHVGSAEDHRDLVPI